MSLWVSIEHLTDGAGKPNHILIVVDDRYMLGMLVGADAG